MLNTSSFILSSPEPQFYRRKNVMLYNACQLKVVTYFEDRFSIHNFFWTWKILGSLAVACSKTHQNIFHFWKFKYLTFSTQPVKTGRFRTKPVTSGLNRWAPKPIGPADTGSGPVFVTLTQTKYSNYYINIA